MELNFTKVDNLWVAEFSVSGEFNLHLERNEGGQLNISQRTAGSNYEHIEDAHQLDSRLIFDADFQALIYPKWIKIKSAVKPLVATITTDGEVNEVVYQAKDIEITSNGTTKVTADTGYTALASVNVKVNVPTEGGGGSGGDSMIYVDIRNVTGSTMDIANLKGGALLFNVTPFEVMEGMILKGVQMGYILFLLGTDKCDALGIDLNMKINDTYSGRFVTVEEMLVNNDSMDFFNSLPRLTKEEFYNLNA